MAKQKNKPAAEREDQELEVAETEVVEAPVADEQVPDEVVEPELEATEEDAPVVNEGVDPARVEAGTVVPEPAAILKPRPKVETKAPTSLAKQNDNGVSANPAFLTWPTDRWGLTKDFKAAVVAMASRINGSEDKKAVVDEAIRIALGHLEARYAQDSAKRG